MDNMPELSLLMHKYLRKLGPLSKAMSRSKSALEPLHSRGGVAPGVAYTRLGKSHIAILTPLRLLRLNYF